MEDSGLPGRQRGDFNLVNLNDDDFRRMVMEEDDRHHGDDDDRKDKSAVCFAISSCF